MSWVSSVQLDVLTHIDIWINCLKKTETDILSLNCFMIFAFFYIDDKQNSNPSNNPSNIQPHIMSLRQLPCADALTFLQECLLIRKDAFLMSVCTVLYKKLPRL